MQIKSKILISGAVVTLIALALIQWYLTSNSYELQKRTIKIDALNAIAGISSTKEIFDIGQASQNKVLETLSNTKEHSTTWQKDILVALRQASDSLNPYFNSIFEAELAKRDLDVDLQITLGSIELIDTLGVADTIFGTKLDTAFYLFGNLTLDHNKGVLINNRTWTQDINIPVLGKYNKLQLKTHIYMHLDKLESVIIQKLAGLFLGVFVLMSFVIFLVVYAIHNLIKHKKLSDIQRDFINNITHELKTPLTTQKIALKQLNNIAAKQAVLETIEPTINTLNRQSVRLEKLIDQVVNNSLGYKELKLNKEHFEIAQWLRAIVNDFKLTLPEGVSITMRVNGDGATINADTFHLATTVLNFLSNAVKYNGQNIEVLTSIDTNENYYIIHIKDDGIGIDKKHHQLIFDKFYRVSEQNKHNYKGLGLGLYYCYQSVKAHFGKIEVESEKGKGSTFSIYLPLNHSAL